MRELYELKGDGRSIRGIARELGISRNTVRKYVRSDEVPKPSPRARRGSKLDPLTVRPHRPHSHYRFLLKPVAGRHSC